MIVKLVEDRDTRVDPVSSWGSVALLSSTTMVSFTVSFAPWPAMMGCIAIHFPIRPDGPRTSLHGPRNYHPVLLEPSDANEMRQGTQRAVRCNPFTTRKAMTCSADCLAIVTSFGDFRPPVDIWWFGDAAVLAEVDSSNRSPA